MFGMKNYTAMLICLFAAFTTQAQDTTPFDKAPEWSKSAIWYQIFPERFRNGDSKNNPKPENINIPLWGKSRPKAGP
jgi:cyclomaltodextrinase